MKARRSHQWIDPNDPPSSRAPYSLVIGPRRHEMKPSVSYRCQRCGTTLTTVPHRVRGVIAEVCSVCAYPLESTQHVNHGRSLGGLMQPFDQALQIIAGIMRDGVAKHPDNEWVRRSVEYHIGRAEEHLHLLREGEQLEDHLAHAATRLLMALTLREIS